MGHRSPILPEMAATGLCRSFYEVSSGFVKIFVFVDIGVDSPLFAYFE